MIERLSSGRPGAAWYTVLLLAVLAIFSTVDRTILALLAQPISISMRLTDTQMGLILGLGFGVLYSVAGLPLAYWIDKRGRRAIVTAGVVLWSSMTIASAFAFDFWSLLICRAGVAFGEAVLSPAAVSLIGNLFARDERTLPMSIYGSIGGIFAAGSFIVGAGVLELASSISSAAALAPWQMTLLLLGAPGIFLGLLFFATAHEPARVAIDSADGRRTANLRPYLLANWRFYLPLILGAGTLACFSYAIISWLPTMLYRYHGYSLQHAGYVYGAIGIAAGAIGTLVIPQLAARIERKRIRYGVPTTLLALSVLMAPFMTLTPLSSGPAMLLLGVFFTTMGGASWSIMMPLAFQTFAPSQVRARLMALFLLASNLIGLSVGPVAAVYFSGFWQETDRALAFGVATIGFLASPVLVLCYVATYRAAAKIELSVD